MASDVHRDFPDPARGDARELAEFLLAVERLPGIRHVRRRIAARLPAAMAGGTVVDVGCGAGWETQRLAAAHPSVRVVGLDHNPALIAAARARVPGGRPEWVCADLTEPVLPAGSVDVVRAERVLMYVTDLPAALDALVALLVPGGRLVAFELDYGGTLLGVGRAGAHTVRRVQAHLEGAPPQPWAGRRIPALLHQRGLTVTVEPHSFAVDRAVWRWVVHDTVRRGIDDGQLDADRVGDWLAELDEPDVPGVRAVFTGLLTTARLT